MSEIVVTQADRTAAARVWSWMKVLSRDQENDIAAGRWDKSEIVQAFARHRIEALEQAAKVADGIATEADANANSMAQREDKYGASIRNQYRGGYEAAWEIAIGIRNLQGEG